LSDDVNLFRENESEKDSEYLFNLIGTDKQMENELGLILENYLSWSERILSASLQVSGPVFFVNSGSRNNKGNKEADGTYEKTGIVWSAVGAQIERVHSMFAALILITQKQNTQANGYGKHGQGDNKRKLDIMAKLFGLEYFPTFDEVKQLRADQKNDGIQKKYLRIEKKDIVGDFEKKMYLQINEENEIFFDVELYKKHLESIIEPLLEGANNEGKQVGKKVFCHTIGLGLGVWKITEEQEQFMLDAYQNALNKFDLSHIEELHFGGFSAKCAEKWSNFASTLESNKDIKFSFSYYNEFAKTFPRNPSKKLDKDLLLVQVNAWDSFSCVTNEFWNGDKDGSGDAALGCSCTAGSMQNPCINPYLYPASQKLASDFKAEKKKREGLTEEIGVHCMDDSSYSSAANEDPAPAQSRTRNHGT
jgi:hypothetical protein